MLMSAENENVTFVLKKYNAGLTNIELKNPIMIALDHKLETARYSSKIVFVTCEGTEGETSRSISTSGPWLALDGNQSKKTFTCLSMQYRKRAQTER